MHYPLMQPLSCAVSRESAGRRSHVCNSAVGLARIDEADVNLVVWKRAPAEVLEAAARFAGSGTRASAVDQVMTFPAGDAAQTRRQPIGPLTRHEALHTDVLMLAEWFSRRVRASNVRVRLGADPAAPAGAFSVEPGRLRLLVTYAGPPVQFAAHDGVHRSTPAVAAGANGYSQSCRLLPGAAVWLTRPGWVLLLKGDAYPGNEGQGVVYRFTAVIHDTSARLYLAIDVGAA